MGGAASGATPEFDDVSFKESKQGLIRLVDEDKVKAVAASFKDFDNRYNPACPVPARMRIPPFAWATPKCVRCALQVLVVPFIEDNPAAIKVYLADEGTFWLRLSTPDDPFSTIPLIIMDGAHRHHVSLDLALEDMRTLYARPTISISEQTALGHARNRMTTDGHVKQTDADNMYSFVQLVNERKFTQVLRMRIQFFRVLNGLETLCVDRLRLWLMCRN
jgi:hypothetical protein